MGYSLDIYTITAENQSMLELIACLIFNFVHSRPIEAGHGACHSRPLSALKSVPTYVLTYSDLTLGR